MKNFRAEDMPSKMEDVKKDKQKKVDSVEPGIADKAKKAAKENPAAREEATETKTAPKKTAKKKDD